MNIKVVAVFLVCACVAAEARPSRGKSAERGSGSEDQKLTPDAATAADKGRDPKDAKPDLISATVRRLKKLCEGLSSGNITNNNSSYDDVFTALGGVCADVATYLEAQAAQAPVQDPAAGTARHPREKGSRSGGAHEGNHREESAGVPDEARHEHDGNQALARLFKICKGLELLRAYLPADLAADLVNIVNKMETVCTAADHVRNPVAPAVSE